MKKQNNKKTIESTRDETINKVTRLVVDSILENIKLRHKFLRELEFINQSWFWISILVFWIGFITGLIVGLN